MRAGRSTRRAGAGLIATGSLLLPAAAGLLVLALRAPADPQLPVLVAAGVAGLLGLIRFRQGKRFLLGAGAERHVGRALARAASDLGYDLRHDVRKRGGGNLDHLLLTRRLAAVVETKHSRFTAADIAQARRHLAYARRRPAPRGRRDLPGARSPETT